MQGLCKGSAYFCKVLYAYRDICFLASLRTIWPEQWESFRATTAGLAHACCFCLSLERVWFISFTQWIYQRISNCCFSQFMAHSCNQTHKGICEFQCARNNTLQTSIIFPKTTMFSSQSIFTYIPKDSFFFFFCSPFPAKSFSRSKMFGNAAFPCFLLCCFFV